MSLRGTLPSSSMISAMWSTPQWVVEKEEDKQHIDQSVSRSGPLWVCGGRDEEVVVVGHKLIKLPDIECAIQHFGSSE